MILWMKNLWKKKEKNNNQKKKPKELKIIKSLLKIITYLKRINLKDLIQLLYIIRGLLSQWETMQANITYHLMVN